MLFRSALRDDPGLRAILESSIYGDNVTDAVIVDTKGVVMAAADRSQEGQPLPPREDLATVVDAPGLFDGVAHGVKTTNDPAIRARMASTGEPYSEASRALLGATGPTPTPARTAGNRGLGRPLVGSDLGKRVFDRDFAVFDRRPDSD